MKAKVIMILFLFLMISTICSLGLTRQVQNWKEQLKNDPENKELLLRLGRHYHNMTGEGKNKEAVRKADQYLSDLLKIDPTGSIALVYYGSVQTMKARHGASPWESMELLKKGFSCMDKAVTINGENPEIRLIRGINSTSVPEDFGRLFLALNDFNAIDEMKSNRHLDFGKEFWLPFYFYYGLALERGNNQEEAKIKLQRVFDIDPGSEYAQRAGKLLDKRKN